MIPPFKIFGYSLIVARFVNIFISSLIVPLLFIILKDGLNCNNKQSFFISLFYSIYPPAIFYSSLILSENLAALLTLLVFYYTLKVLKSNKYSKIILLGLNLALLSLTRSSNYYLIFFIIFGILVFENKKPKFYYQKFATMLIVFYMTMSPLIIYNQITFGRFLPTEPRLGYGLYLSNNDLENSSIKTGGYFRDEYLITSSKVKMNAKELIERDDLLKAKALDEIFSNPQNLILPIINRFINFWTFRPNPIKNNITTNDYIMFLVWVPILIFYGYSFFVVKEKKYL